MYASASQGLAVSLKYSKIQSFWARDDATSRKFCIIISFLHKIIGTIYITFILYVQAIHKTWILYLPWPMEI